MHQLPFPLVFYSGRMLLANEHLYDELLLSTTSNWYDHHWKHNHQISNSSQMVNFPQHPSKDDDFVTPHAIRILYQIWPSIDIKVHLQQTNSSSSMPFLTVTPTSFPITRIKLWPKMSFLFHPNNFRRPSKVKPTEDLDQPMIPWNVMRCDYVWQIASNYEMESNQVLRVDTNHPNSPRQGQNTEEQGPRAF